MYVFNKTTFWKVGIYKICRKVLNAISMMSQEKYCVITGANQGLGKALACCELAQRNKNLILVSLPNEGLDSFALSLEKKFNP